MKTILLLGASLMAVTAANGLVAEPHLMPMAAWAGVPSLPAIELSTEDFNALTQRYGRLSPEEAGQLRKISVAAIAGPMPYPMYEDADTTGSQPANSELSNPRSHAD